MNKKIVDIQELIHFIQLYLISTNLNNSEVNLVFSARKQTKKLQYS